MDFNKLDDITLMRLVVSRQQEALSELYDRFGRLVYSIGLNAGGQAELAEEITQDVFLRVWQRAETYRPEQGKVVTWLSQVARNRAIDMIRQRSIRAEAHSISWDDLPNFDLPDDSDIESVSDLNQLALHVRQAVAGLPEDQRRALALAYFQGLTHQEIADLLGEPLGTIKTRIRLAMQKLRQIL